MNFTEFKNSITSGEVGSIYYFSGEETFFLKRGLELIKSKLLTSPEFNYTEFDETADEGEITASLMQYPLLGDRRITVVREFYPDKKISEELKNYLDNPNKESVLVVLDKEKSDYLEKLESVIKVDCKKADVSSIVKYVKGTAQSEGVGIDGETASKLGEYCLLDMVRIETELKKLISYVGENGTIRIEDVEENVTRDTEYKIYEMTDYLGKKDFSSAIRVLSEMLGKGETPQRMLVALYNYFRKLLHIGISREENEVLAEQFGMKSAYAVKKVKEQAKMFNPRSIKRAVDRLSDLDYETKCGIVNADDGMWISVFRIMAE